MIKKLVLISTIFISLFANSNFVDIYRERGIKAVEDLLSKELEKKEYWLESIKDRDLSFGFYENLQYLLFCDKNEKKFTLYEYKDNSFIEISNIYAYTGLLGDKFKEGDLKTPVGVYSLRYKKSKVDEFYGPLALVTSYPNVFDRVQGKDGHGIWIHGLPYKSERPDNTKGCIALDNEYLTNLDKIIDIKKSILLTTEDGYTFDANREDFATILADLYRWKRAWSESDIDTYLSFYDKSFIRYDKLKYSDFSKYKRKIFSKKEKKRIIFKNINISPYPAKDNKKLFRVSFFEDYSTNSYKFKGQKELYLELKNSKIYILSEK